MSRFFHSVTLFLFLNSGQQKTHPQGEPFAVYQIRFDSVVYILLYYFNVYVYVKNYLDLRNIQSVY